MPRSALAYPGIRLKPPSTGSIFALTCAFLLVLASGLWSRAAWAGPSDNKAKKAIVDAMDEYAKSKDVDKADGRLLEAISVCGNDCKASVLARAWMYIGLVKGGGSNDWDTAREAFSVALGFDEKLELDPRFFSPTAQALFDGIKGKLGKNAPAEVVPRFEAGTQMGCWPLVQEVETHRPIPVSCSTRVQGVDGVVLSYREYGANNWTRIDLKREGDDWRGEIPCSALVRAGTWGMYIEAKDARDNPLERLGSRDRPIVFQVVEKSEEPPPSLPGEPAPDKCVATAYCPEEMIGTPACDALQGGPSAPTKDTNCEESKDCDLGMECVEGSCRAPGICTKDADCPDDGICQAGLCTERPGGGRRDWFGLHFGTDFASLGGADDVCRSPPGEYACFDGSDTYEGTPHPGSGGTVAGGLHIGTMRAMMSYERFLLENVSLGVRFGFAFSGAPDGFFPLHFEGRGTYYFGDVTKGRSSFVPYVAAGFGLAQVDTRVEVQMVDCKPESVDACQDTQGVNDGLIDDPADPNDDADTARLTTLSAYKSLGKVFATISPGVMVSFSKELSGVANVGVLLMTEERRSTSIILNLQPSLGLVLGF